MTKIHADQWLDLYRDTIHNLQPLFVDARFVMGHPMNQPATKDFVIGCIRLTRRPISASQSTFRTSRFDFIRRSMSLVDFDPHLRALTSGGSSPTFLGETLRLGAHHYEHWGWQPSANDLSDKPGWEFRLGQSQPNVSTLSDPLLSYNSRPFLSGAGAIVDFVQLNNFGGSHDGRLGWLLFFIEDSRILISNVRFLLDRLQVDVDQGEMPIKTCQVQAIVRAQGKELYSGYRPLNGPKAEIPISMEPDEIHLFVVDENHTILDRHWEDPFAASSNRRFLDENLRPTSGLTKEVLEGEGGQLEFKEFIPPKDGNLVARFLRTVVAFANTRGGKVVIGLDDEGNPIGLAKPLRALYSPKAAPDISDLQRRYSLEIKKLLQERTNRPVKNSVSFDKVRGETVIVVEVPEAAEKPCSFDVNEIFIRKGATNRRPDADAELPRLISR